MNVSVLQDDGVHKKSIINREESKIEEEVENEDSRDQNSDVMIDVSDEEKLCRICHLSGDDDDSTNNSSELIQLGCDCRGDLGISHRNCADLWFSQKGNRVCEICGKTAKNISNSNDEASDNTRLAMEVMMRVLVGGAPDRSNEDSPRQICKINSLCRLTVACLFLTGILWIFGALDFHFMS